MLRALKILLSASILLAGGSAFATDGQEPETTPLAQWQEDPTQVFDAADLDVGEFKWSARPVIVFAESPNDPAFKRQMELLLDDIDALVERDVVLITDTDPQERSALRTKFRPHGFAFHIVGKDGGLQFRSPFPWTVRKINASIDKMPIRREEIRAEKLGTK